MSFHWIESSRKSDFFSLKRPIFPHAGAPCSELPYLIQVPCHSIVLIGWARYVSGRRHLDSTLFYPGLYLHKFNLTGQQLFLEAAMSFSPPVTEIKFLRIVIHLLQIMTFSDEPTIRGIYYAWFLYKMVAQNTLRTHVVKEGIFREKKSDLTLFRCNQMPISNRNS